MRQLAYTIFITNNYASFHLWWKGSIVKHHKVSNYYENDFLQNFLLLFLSLLTAPIDKNGDIIAVIKFISLKNPLKQNSKSSNITLRLQQKDQKSSMKVKQVLALFATWLLKFYVKTVRKAWELQNLSKKSSLNRSGGI